MRSTPTPVTRRVVVVDRDPKVRSGTVRALRAPEFDTHAFASAGEALAHCDEIRPDCVVTDAGLPDMPCERFLRALRERPGLQNLPVVVLSVARSATRLRALQDAGADACLLKPFPFQELVDKVRSLTVVPTLADGGAMTPGSPARPRATSDSATQKLQALAPPPKNGTGSGAATVDVTRGVASPVAPKATAETTRGKASAAEGRGEERLDELAHPEATEGLGRYTRVDRSGRSLVVLTEASPRPRFVVTTVIAEKGWALRKIATELPHALAREDDRDLVRRQIDMQHDAVLDRLDSLVVDIPPRRIVWSRGLVP